jgi:hypothetical protein
MRFKPADPETIAWLENERREAVRIIVSWSSSITVDELAPRKVRITDCTSRGCRIETDLAVTVGTFVYVVLPLFEDVPGWVAWSSSDALGIDFSHPLQSKILEYIIEQNNPF